ncbi:hypothetical protein [Paenibacillus chitinolyticus]|uniref:hypothetical protein n=1 Tax=Paenibacillus chitinolyticus TaxID=79263 RepID=UPI0036713601
MEYAETVKAINHLFTYKVFDKQIYHKVQSLFSNLSVRDAAGIFGDLSNEAIFGLYLILDDLKTTNEAKEHIIYKYYGLKIKEQANETVEGSLVEQIFGDYKKTSFLALESLIVKILKEDRISENHFEKLKESFDSKIIEKEIYSNRIRSKIRGKFPLSESELLKLFEYENYKLIEDALAQELIEYSALPLFRLPNKGDKNKKIKTVLFNKATKLIEMKP